MKRGDVVIVPIPFQDKLGEKIRPAVVVQCDAENRRLGNTIVAMVSGNLKDLGRSTTMLIDPGTVDGASSGLHGASLLKCYTLATVRQKRILKLVGHLSDALKQKLNDCLKAELDVV